MLPYLILCALMLGMTANGYALLPLPLAVPAVGPALLHPARLRARPVPGLAPRHRLARPLLEPSDANALRQLEVGSRPAPCLHLNSRIPNYRLQECLDGHEILGRVGRLTLRESLGCLNLALWDQEARKLIGFARVRRLQGA